MLELTASIRKAIECECYYPALALALTVPDICGQIAHPELVYKEGRRKGQRKVGDQYSAWFDENVAQYCTYHHYPGGETKHVLTGKMCYNLRCKVLHEGHDRIDGWDEVEDGPDSTCKFTLCVHGSSCVYDETIADEQTKASPCVHHIKIDIGELCTLLCDCADAFVKQVGEEAFAEHWLPIVDAEKVRSHLRVSIQE